MSGSLSLRHSVVYRVVQKKYPCRQYAISLQLVARLKFLNLLNPDTTMNQTVYNIPTVP